MMEQHISCARHRRSSKRSNNGISRDRRFDFFGLEPTIENGIGGASKDFDCLLAIVAELVEVPRSFGELNQVIRRQRPRVGRGLDQHGFQEAGDAFEHGFEFAQVLGVLFREL